MSALISAISAIFSLFNAVTSAVKNITAYMNRWRESKRKIALGKALEAAGKTKDTTDVEKIFSRNDIDKPTE